MPHRISYRPDIDGLRAIAVLLVVASHLRVPHLAGGYVGVDVFFVISGYLISSIIIPEIVSGTFSLRAFYERRLRRIAPALFVMLASTIPIARHFLYPSELTAYARSLVAAALACSNTLFWGWRGYFDNSNELKPLLHTWSLGVEEQFYFAFPLLLMLIARLRKPQALRGALLTLAAVSFVAACWFATHHPRRAFFSSPLRAWELLLGAILSQRKPLAPGTREQKILRRAWRVETLGLLGLALILVPAIFYTDATPFPGLTAVAPCLGALLLIATGEHNTLIGRMLTLRPMVSVGLISYSVYLWHWPLIVFANLRHTLTCEAAECAAPLGAGMRCMLFAAALALGALSWLVVERPFRDRRRITTRALLGCSAATLSMLLAFGVYALRTEGEPQRFPPSVLSAAQYLALDTPWRWNQCALALDDTAARFDRSTCLPYTPGHTHYLLLGDSHAAQLWPGLREIFPDVQIGQLNVAGCNLMPSKQNDPTSICRSMARFVYRDLLPSHRVDTLIVGGQWFSQDIPQIAELVAYTRGHHIGLLLLGPNTAYTLSAPRLLARLEMQHRMREVATFADNTQPQLDRELSTLAATQWHIPYVSFFDESCDRTRDKCLTYTPSGAPILLDRNHLTPAASAMVAASLRDHHRLP